MMKLLFTTILLANSAFASVPTERFNANEPVNTTLPTGPAPRVPTAVLFDQGPLTNQTDGTPPTPVSVLITAAPFTYNTLGFSAASAQRTADDFVVPAGQTWTVDSVTVYAYQTGATGVTLNGATLRIWNVTPTAAGTSIFGDTTTNRFLSASLSGAFRVSDTAITGRTRALQALRIAVSPAAVLPAGTYWIDWNTAGSAASGPFAPPIVPAIATSIATGNAIQFDGTAWNPLNIGLAIDPPAGPLTGPQQGMPFVIEGTTGAIGAPAITPATPAGAISFTLPATRSFVFNNSPTATAAGTVACTITGAGFSVVPTTTQNVAIGANTTFVVSAAAPGTGMLSCAIQGVAQSVVYNLTAVLPVAPTPITATTITGSTVVLPEYLTTGPGISSTTLNFGITGGAGQLACVASGTGFSVAPNFLNLTVAGPNAITVTYSGNVPGTFVGAVVCTPVAPAIGGPFTYNFRASVASPTVPVPALGNISLMLLIAGFLGLGMVLVGRKA